MDLTDEQRERAQASPSSPTTAPGWSRPSLARSAGHPPRQALDLADGGAMERSAPALSPYQLCHRRCQAWVRSDIVARILQALAATSCPASGCGAARAGISTLTGEALGPPAARCVKPVRHR
jgi:hypothetical protein